MVVGSEYYSKRGWAPNGDFRYKGPGLDHLIVRWNALLDRGVEQQIGATIPTASAQASPTSQQSPHPQPADLSPAPSATNLSTRAASTWSPIGRKDLSPDTRVAGNVEYLLQLRLPAGLQRQLRPGHQL